MQLHVSFERVGALAELAALREAYFDSIELAQEPIIEVMVAHGDGYFICDQAVRCGYVIIHEQTLLEFFLTPSYWVYGECVFEQMLARGLVQRALVKSFDHLLFSSCIARQRSLRVKGLLVRELILRELPQGAPLQCRTRVATLLDLPQVLAVDQPVFRDPERLRVVIEHGYLHLFESDHGVVGFGIARPIVAGRKHVELGIAVDRPHRMQGLAVAMFRAMIEACLAEGLVPVAGVAVDNVASRSMGERVGMVARYRLLELTF